MSEGRSHAKKGSPSAKRAHKSEGAFRRHRFALAVLLGLGGSLYAVPVLGHNAVFIESFFALFLLYDLLQELLEPSFEQPKSIALGLLAVVAISWAAFVLQFGSLHHHIHHHGEHGHAHGKAPTYDWDKLLTVHSLQLELHSLNFVLVMVSASAVIVRMLLPHAEHKKED